MRDPGSGTSLPRRALLAGAALALPGLARAQEAWPNRPVRIIVPFPPGGSNDAVARPLADRLQALLGQPVVIENRGGAGGAIGAGQVAQAAADGHTLMVTSSSFATSAVIQRTPWDAEGSFDAVALLARAPFYIMVNPAFPPRTVAEFVAYCRARPGAVDYASSGAGGINHFITEYFCLRAGVRMNHIPYRGTATAVTDLVAGHVPVLFTTIASASAAVREGRVRLIAATAPGGDLTGIAAPVPTVQETGLDYDVSIWWGLLAPKGLPAAVRATVHRQVQAALTDPNLVRIYASEGATPAPSGPQAMTELLHADLARWREVRDAANIRPE